MRPGAPADQALTGHLVMLPIPAHTWDVIERAAGLLHEEPESFAVLGAYFRAREVIVTDFGLELTV